VTCDTRGVPDEAPVVSRSPRVLVALATMGAVTVLVSLGVALTRPSPARDVSFVGGNDDDDARCHGPVVWTGDVAWATCDWFYRDRALVELDPEAARATVLHRWSVDEIRVTTGGWRNWTLVSKSS